ncbi:hypothetical protein GGI07_000205 [Coemansia sp. Benny D115]|nr:hypothetical protein GGI07_000205 [Coemansia sp. Benny D115]
MTSDEAVNGVDQGSADMAIDGSISMVPPGGDIEAKDSGMGFDIGSSTLGGLTMPVPESGRDINKYDPLAQLLGSDNSDSDSDSDGEKSPVSKQPIRAPVALLPPQEPKPAAEKTKKKTTNRKQFSTARFKLDKGVKKDSVVGRLSMPNSRRMVASDDSDSDVETKKATLVHSKASTQSKLRVDSDSDSESDLRPTPKQPTEEAPVNAEKHARKERKASKLAMALMHRETERLVRETAVKIDPLDFTRLLALDDFFARYDQHIKQAIRPPQPLGREKPTEYRYESDSDDYDVEIVDSGAGLPKSQLLALDKHAEAEPRGDQLEAILSYGSQPMNRAKTAGAVKKTDGPLALRTLNEALMQSIYAKDVEAKNAKERREARRRRKSTDPNAHDVEEADVEATAEGGAGDQAEEDGMEVEASEEIGSESDGDYEAVYKDEGEDEGASSHGDDTDGMSVAGESQATQSRKARTVLDDDDDDDDDDVSRKESTNTVAMDKAEKTSADAPASRAKFLSMFKMPKPTTAPVASAVSAKSSEPIHAAQALSVQSISTSQDPSVHTSQEPPMHELFMFSSQLDCEVNTQDSLLLTPEVPTQQQIANDADEREPPMGAGDGLTQMMTQDDLLQSTQPTQPLQSTQPTQLMADEDDEGIIPAAVQHAVAFDAAVSAAEESAQHATHEAPETAEAAHRRGRLIRRGAPPTVAPKGPQLLGAGDNKKQKKKKRLRSEFVEAEAEEGSSSDSENEGHSRQQGGKFSWGDQQDGRGSGDESEEDSEEDSEAEAELAAELIDDAEGSDAESGNQAVRDLHRRQDFDEDEQEIQKLARDIATGGLRHRSAQGLGLVDDENYIDRQTRAERMAERRRLRRSLEARAIHDASLAAIARNPETAAFAQAALMRAPTGTMVGTQGGSDAEDAALDLEMEEDGVFELDEVLDDEHQVAHTVQRQLARHSSSNSGGNESDGGEGTGAVGGRINGKRSNRPGSLIRSLLASDAPSSSDVDADLASVDVAGLIVRRRTLLKRPGDLPPLPPTSAKKRQTTVE